MFFLSSVIFILGTAIGSFLNVVIDRTTQGKSILSPFRSYCDHCKATLATVDLIPIVSFVGLGGKCRFCKKPISWQYPFVEALTGVLFVVDFYVLASSGELSLLKLFLHFFLISIFIVVAVVDFKFSLIPTSLVFLASLVALFFNYFNLPSEIFVQNVMTAFALAAFFALVAVLTRGRGMGTGDIPLVFLVGLMLGFPNGLISVFLAFIAGALVAIFLILIGTKKFGQTIPFAPFLAGAAVLMLFFGDSISQWYLGMMLLG